MADFQRWIDTELDAVRVLQDDVRARARRFEADARAEWARMETRLEVIGAEVWRFREHAREPLAEVGEALKRLLAEAGEALERMQTRPALYNAPRPGRLRHDPAR